MEEKANLLPGERIDDLQRNNLKMIQNEEKFCFGMDAVLLSGFAKVKPGERVLDMGTGTGIIPILLSAKTEAGHLTALEIQEESADILRPWMHGLTCPRASQSSCWSTSCACGS